MAWIEKRRNGWIVRRYVKGKSTPDSDYFVDRADPEWFQQTLDPQDRCVPAPN